MRPDLRRLLDLRRFLTALPLLFLSFCFAFAQSPVNEALGLDIERLDDIIGIEFFVICSMFFVLFFAAWRPPKPVWRIAGCTALIPILLFFVWRSYDTAGVWGACAFAGLTVVTYVRLMFHLFTSEYATRVASQWTVSAGTFFVSLCVGGMFNPTSVTPSDPAWGLPGGALYFLFLGLFEWYGIPQYPGRQ